MPVSIQLDDEVFAELQSRAVPLVDSPNSVLRRLLGLRNAAADNDTQDVQSETPRRAVQRARAGDLLSEREYELPILRFLVARGGEAPTSEVIRAVGAELADQLTEADRTLNASGLIRWQNRVQFARLTLVTAGDMDPDSPRGIWRITEQGRERLSADRDA